MTKSTMIVKLLFFISVFFTMGGVADGLRNNSSTSKGGHLPMITFHVGRFSIAMPAQMHEAQGSRSHTLRDEAIKEIIWPEGVKHENAREAEWSKFMAKIKTISRPKGKGNTLLRIQDLSEVGLWSKAAFYHSTHSSRTATWAILMDTGPVGVWIKDDPPVLVDEENKNRKAFNNINNIGRSYYFMNLKTAKPKGDWFYLKHGAINLPYLWQEESDVRFEGHPLNLTIRVEMKMDGAYKIEPHGLMEKASAMIDSGYAAMAGVKVKRLRSQKRDVAGMPGEEVVDRLTTKNGTELDFGWEFIGKEDSGEYPTTRITMESPDGNLDEKLKIWDAVLDSMQPMFVRK